MQTRALILIALAGAPALTAQGLEPPRRADPTPLADGPSWTEDVRPILAEHCFACHGPDEAARAAGVRLDVAEGLRGDGDAFAPVAPGDPGGSELLYRVTSPDDFDRMPPPEAGDGLTDDEIDTLRAWIAAGAEYEEHWAYAPLAGAALGVVEADGRERSPIDSFVRARLREEGRDLAPDAAPLDLVRRVHFDLVGLPPEPEVVAAFAADPTDAAYAALVDALLASPDFGVHWARQWLDAARYADSHGFTIDGRRSIWPWRDWVVDSMNRDQPFDAFTIEQLAGDLLPGATRAQRIATGFHRNTQVNQEGGAKDEENRVSAVMDRVATTGSVWLGSTIACAQCHTHKFDPITQTEYFGLYAFFDSTTDGGVSAAPSMLVPRDDGEEQRAAAWEARLADAEAAYADAWAAAAAGFTPWQPGRATGSNGPELRPELDGSYRVLGQNPVYSTYVLEGAAAVEVADTLRLEALPDGGPGRGPQRNFVLQEVRVEVKRDPDGAFERVPLASARADFEQDTSARGGGRYPIAAALRADDGGWAIAPAFDGPHAAVFRFREPIDLAGATLRVELRQEFGSNHTLGRFRMLLGARGSADGAGADAPLVTEAWRAAWRALRDVRGERPRMPSTLVMEERATPRVTRRFHRGSFLDPREPVRPHVPAALDRFRADAEGGAAPLRTRLDLARWLVHPRNALAHRVTVNRWWQALFGLGLVETENDFGLRGARPSHPGLLDWLAAEFVRSGLSRKALLREIVLSTTYRQTSTVPARGDDPRNRLLGRQRRLRLTGEQLRDAMLRVSGALDPTRGGRPVQPPQPPGVYAFTQANKRWETGPEDERLRRSLYTRIWRSAPYPFYSTFDAPSASVACTRRDRSTSPLQALALANDPMVLELARRFGDALSRGDADDAAMVERAFRRALGRAPLAAEVERLADHLSAVADREGADAVPFALARVVFNLAEFTHRP